MSEKILGDVCIRCTEKDLTIGLEMMYKGYESERPDDCIRVFSEERCTECSYKEKCRAFWAVYTAIKGYTRLDTPYNRAVDEYAQKEV